MADSPQEGKGTATAAPSPDPKPAVAARPAPAYRATRAFSAHYGTQLLQFEQDDVLDPQQGADLASKGAPVRPIEAE